MMTTIKQEDFAVPLMVIQIMKCWERMENIMIINIVGTSHGNFLKVGGRYGNFLDIGGR